MHLKTSPPTAPDVGKKAEKVPAQHHSARPNPRPVSPAPTHAGQACGFLQGNPRQREWGGTPPAPTVLMSVSLASCLEASGFVA